MPRTVSCSRTFTLRRDWRCRCRGHCHFVPPHVAAEGLPHRKGQPAHAAGVEPWTQHPPAPVTAGAELAASAVAGPVAAQRLERREPAAARLALERPAVLLHPPRECTIPAGELQAPPGAPRRAAAGSRAP